MNDLLTLKRGRLSWLRYPTHTIGTYLGRGVRGQQSFKKQTYRELLGRLQTLFISLCANDFEPTAMDRAHIESIKCIEIYIGVSVIHGGALKSDFETVGSKRTKECRNRSTTTSDMLSPPRRSQSITQSLVSAGEESCEMLLLNQGCEWNIIDFEWDRSQIQSIDFERKT